MKTFLLSAAFLLAALEAHPRPNFNIDSIFSKSIAGTEGCWGYVDSATNREYALVCANTRLEIWDVSIPESATLVRSVPATGRDLKQVRPFSKYALAVNQRDSGLQVIDLSNPAAAFTAVSYRTETTNGGAHTIHIDGHFAYLGMNGNGAPWRIIDISDPLNLTPAGRYTTSNTGGFLVESHDGYVKGDTAYVAFLSGGFSILDVRSKFLPKKIADVIYPDAFTHNCWPTEDGRYLFTSDELNGGHLRVWDIRDAVNPVQVAEWAPPGIPSIIHNVQTKGIYLYLSYYADGVVILDIDDPTQPIEVGHYDTAPQAQSSGNYAGCWDVFPYFPSGTLVASNYSGPAGMWLLRFNGAKAGRITGTVIDFLSGEPVPDVTVRVLDVPRQSRTDSAGNFSVRTDSGNFRLEFSRTDFLAETLSVSGRLNDTTDLGTIQLKPTSLLPTTPSNFAAQPVNGGNIHLSWQRPPDTNLAGFRLYRTSLTDTVNFFPLDSMGPAEGTYVDSGATPGERFFYRISAINNLGLTSFHSPTVKAIRFVFGKKLLLVDRTAYCPAFVKRYPIAPDSFYNFHARLLRRQDFDTLLLNDCLTRFAVDPTFVSRHPYIVLHSSEFFTPLAYDNASFLSFFADYTKAGGKLLVEAQWTPLQSNPVTLCDFNSVLLPNANEEIWDTVRAAFGFDCLYYPLVHILNNSTVHQSFAGAQSKSSAYPHLTVDSVRVDYFVPTTGSFTRYPYPTMPNVGYLTGRDSAENLYTFNSLLGNSDEKHGKTVAKKRIDPNGGGFVWFNFPLYYMKEDSTKKVFRQALTDLGVPEVFPKGDLDRDGVRDIADVTHLTNWVFLGQPFSIFDDDEADLNCDGQSSPADLVLLLLNVFPGQPLPCN
ncbi:MAG TPA: choice-of-anchor B family protein [candidate division Zixibacteria bacterium]|nr:choice-of-anchor B family protein [candidate division Zixibacteria bacterium]